MSTTKRKIWQCITSNSHAAGLTIDEAKRIKNLNLGKYEVETAAKNLLDFFISRGEWSPFSLHELAKYAREADVDPGIMVFGLMTHWYDDGGLGCIRQPPNPPFIVQISPYQFAITTAFTDMLKKNLEA